MPEFRYKARDDYGELVKGVMTAENEDHLADLLQDQGLYLVKSTQPNGFRLTLPTRIKRRDLILLSIHLAAGVAGGISLLDSLRTFAQDTPNDRLRQVVLGLADDITAGATFSEALSRYPKVFSEVYVNMVRAGETTGRLDNVLEDLVRFLEWQENLASTIRQAITYPIVVLVAIGGLITLLITFVLPQLIPVFQKVNVELPLPTRVLIAVSITLNRYWYLILLGLVGTVTGLTLFLRTERGRALFDRVILRVPVVGGVVHRIALSRFARHLSALYLAGVDFILSLSVVERLIGNQVLERVIRAAREQVTGGSLLSTALRGTGVIPPLVIQMVATGEATGELGETLQKVAQYYDREVQESVRRATALIEPAALVLLAGMVLFVALSILLPLYRMVGAIRPRR